jgi:glycyl-tRNA synthetase alpha subunit
MSFRIIEKSLGRIKELEEIKEEEFEDEDDALDVEDLNLIKEEGNNEYDLQLAAAELLGSLFKTHKAFVANIVQHLREKTLNEAFGCGIQKRMKFGLFILDDMVEHLGPSYFAPD